MLEQPALAVETAAIAGERAIGPDQAVTGNDDTDGIGSVGVADRAHRFGDAEFCRQRAVAHRGAGRDGRQRGPDALLERCAAETTWNRCESIELAGEIARERIPDRLWRTLVD